MLHFYFLSLLLTEIERARSLSSSAHYHIRVIAHGTSRALTIFTSRRVLSLSRLHLQCSSEVSISLCIISYSYTYYS